MDVTESPLIIGGVLGIIIIIGIGAIQKSLKTEDKGKAKDIIYMSAIFSMLLVVAVSFAMYRNDVAFDYLSFAGTVTSIVLSVIAIIMTISSERKSDNVKAQLDLTVREMKQINEDLSKKVAKMKKYSDSIVNKLKDIKADTEMIRQMQDLEQNNTVLIDDCDINEPQIKVSPVKLLKEEAERYEQ